MILIDVRDLNHPEPLEKVLAALEILKEDSGQEIQMIHRREPFPLYEILEKQGFEYTVRPFKEEGRDLFEILIRRTK
jgi:uncharacterized protein (DUF2249 family)